MQENSFRVIAIKPLPDCHPALIKILEPGETYFFYQNCQINRNEELKITGDLLAANFFNEDGPTQIEINAIVGKNGSGKSTVVELLLMAINNLAFRYQRYKNQISVVTGLHITVYFQLDNKFYKLKVTDEEAEIHVYSTRQGRMRTDSRVSLRSLFYTIAVNYSHFSFNALDYIRQQRWLPGIFRKNDGYQIPLVLNPFREDGNIDINREKQLANARIMANVLRPSIKASFDFRMLTERHRAVSIRLKAVQIKPERLLSEAQGEEIRDIRFNTVNFDKQSIDRALAKFFHLPTQKMQDEVKKPVIDYIYYKLVSIALKYEVYEPYFDRKQQRFIPELLNDYIQDLNNDKSHIAFKLKQAVNYLRFDLFPIDATRLDLDEYGTIVYEIMNRRSSRVQELIELLPPPVFQPILELKDEKSGAILELNDMSSGEKQWNHSVSTFLYHLNNLDSVPRGFRNRNAYDRTLIILEEIELYFHPDMQRRFVQHVIDSICQLRLKNIKHVQIIMATHSPFVLSDIPEQNILFLDNGEVAERNEVSQTFGGNIHELLAKGFFLRKALVGEFARNKIDMVIKRLQPDSPKLNKDERDELLRTIILIGEDFLREKLLDMLAVKAESLTRQEKIKLLEAQLRNLKEQENDDQTEAQS